MSKSFVERQASSLRAERNRRSLSQDQLAKSIGVSNDSVSKWERGECVMSFENAFNIAELLGCSIGDLCKR